MMGNESDDEIEMVELGIDPNEMKASPSGFLRKDTEKVMVQLIDPDALMELGRVLTMGAKKYERDNWKRGVNDADAHSRTMGSLLRHVYAYQTGEEVDPESGLHHMAHVLCNAMFLFYFDKHRGE